MCRKFYRTRCLLWAIRFKTTTHPSFKTRRHISILWTRILFNVRWGVLLLKLNLHSQSTLLINLCGFCTYNFVRKAERVKFTIWLICLYFFLWCLKLHNFLIATILTNFWRNWFFIVDIFNIFLQNPNFLKELFLSFSA